MINTTSKRGFTLIELMITVAIVGILAAIALPSYQSSIMKSRRADAKTALLELANAMERHYTVHNSYCDAGSGASICGDGGGDDGAPSPSIYTPQHADFYDITIDIVSDTTYTLLAAPKGAQANDDCGNLTLDQSGIRDSANNTLCW